jgi:MFS family permease
VRTLGGGTIWVFSAALLQTLADDQFRGRVFSFEFAAFTLSQSISTLWAGLAQDSLGWAVHQVLLSLSIGSLIVTVLWLIFRFLARQRVALAPAENVSP